MPQSKKRKHHHHSQQHHGNATGNVKDKKSSAVIVAIIFFAIIGLAIAYFTAGIDVLWLAVGTIVGAACGYLFGKQVDNSFSKK